MAVLKAPVIVATYKLLTPIEYGDEFVTQLNFRKLITKDHLDVEEMGENAGNIKKSVKYLELLTNEPPYVINNLSHEDYMGAQKVLADFLK